jgi:hypothetical protein
VVRYVTQINWKIIHTTSILVGVCWKVLVHVFYLAHLIQGMLKDTMRFFRLALMKIKIQLLPCSNVKLGVNPSLGGTTRNHLKERLRNKKQPNNFFAPLSLIFFIIIIFFSCLSIACTNICLDFIWELQKLKKFEILYS